MKNMLASCVGIGSRCGFELVFSKIKPIGHYDIVHFSSRKFGNSMEPVTRLFAFGSNECASMPDG